MPIIDIHGRKVHIEEDSHSGHVAAEFLAKHPDNAQAFFDETHRDKTNGVAHFEIPHSTEHPDISHKFTLIHNGDGTYNLRKQHHF
jgi:hypothetical protein